MALAEAVLRQATDLMTLAASLQPGFSVAQAAGKQLDAIAESMGLRRETGTTDADFRQYLLSKLKLWTWDGTNPGALDVLPAGVTMTDNGDGTVTVTPAGTDPGLLPVPAGVRVTGS